MPKSVKIAEVRIVDRKSNSQLTVEKELNQVIRMAATTEINASEITLASMYSLLRKGDTTRTIRIPCPLSSKIMPPIKNKPSTEGSEKTTKGSAMAKTSSGKNDNRIKYISVMMPYTK